MYIANIPTHSFSYRQLFNDNHNQAAADDSISLFFFLIFIASLAVLLFSIQSHMNRQIDINTSKFIGLSISWFQK